MPSYEFRLSRRGLLTTAGAPAVPWSPNSSTNNEWTITGV
jgi:hypothetical protein